MSRDEKGYNGWRNYETWRVMLEVFDGYDPDGQWMTRDDVRDIAEDYIHMTSTEGLVRDYALAFMINVDWQRIASAINETWETPDPDATDEEGEA